MTSSPDPEVPGCVASSPAPAVPATPVVLVTRPEPDATASVLRARGFDPVIAPFLILRDRAARLPDAAAIQATLAASPRAADRLAPNQRPLLAVGDATAARARARGFPHVHSADGDAAALAGLAASLCDPAGGPLLLACGHGQGHGLATDLRARGFRVLRRVLYAAGPVNRFPSAARDALAARRLHAALFLSAETARAFVTTLPPALVPALTTVEAVVIGERAAAALHALPWRRLAVARHPTLDGVLALL